MLTIESELSERLAAEMRKLAKENKEKIQFVPTSKVRGIVNQDASGTLSRQEIGEKLNESSFASSLVSRIREVMRRRRLTAPTLSGPGVGIDPNTVSEYLDNTLPPDGVADVDVFKRNGIGLVPGSLLMGVRGEIDRSVHRRLLMIRLRGGLRKREYWANYIPLRPPEQGTVCSI